MISYVRGEILYCTDSSVVVDVGNVGVEINVTEQTLRAMEWAEGTVEFYTYLNVKEDALTLFGFESRRELKLFKLLITVSGIGPKSALGILSQISPEDLIAAVISEDSATIAKTPGIGAKSAGKIVLELKDKLSFSDMLASGNTDGVLHVTDEDENASAKGSAGKARSGKKGVGRSGAGKSGKAEDNTEGARGVSSKAGESTGSVRSGGTAGNPSAAMQENKNEAIQALAALGYSVSEAMKAVRSVEIEPGMSTEDILKLSLRYL